MSADSRYVANKDVVDCDIGGERALMHLGTNTYFTMNGTGSVLWLSLCRPQSIDDLVEIVTEHFDVSADQCRPDVRVLVDEMVEARIVDIVPAEVGR
jgi:hypothetical protein